MIRSFVVSKNTQRILESEVPSPQSFNESEESEKQKYYCFLVNSVGLYTKPSHFTFHF